MHVHKLLQQARKKEVASEPYYLLVFVHQSISEVSSRDFCASKVTPARGFMLLK